MTAAEMVAKLRLAMGDEVEPYAVSNAMLFQWLSDAYLRIQLEYEQWEFLNRRKVIFTTTVGQAEYSLPSVKSINQNSVYRNEIGSDVRFPICFMSYDEWILEERAGLHRQGDSQYLISLPGNKYRMEPVPVEVWEVWGNVWLNPAKFYDINDSPVWHERYHSLVVWEALKVAVMERPGDKKSALMQANLVANLVPMRRAFNYEYLNAKGSASSLI